MKPTLIVDTEVFKEYFLVSFMNVETGNVRHFEAWPGEPPCPLDRAVVSAIMSKYRLVSFNGVNFDLPIISHALRGASTQSIKNIANEIIVTGRRWWQLDIDMVECDHIDIIEVAPGIASLKLYAGRLHAAQMRDLPFDPDAPISPDERAVLREYCEGDLQNTLLLYQALAPQIELREQMSAQYGIDLRSKSDAQIAEAVIKHEVERRMKRKLERREPFERAGDTFQYSAPDWLTFDDLAVLQAFNVVRNATFTVAGNGTVKMPAEVAGLKIAIGDSVYRMGIGGLHSSEKSVAHHADDDHVLVDRDVASYYPSIILRCGLQPENMGEHFTAVYRQIVQRRLAAKKAGDRVQDAVLKIVINGSFGKFGSPYSALYSPRLLIQTTVTGQLALLMLIEMLESEGVPVVSANTDGIVIRCPRHLVDMMQFVVWEWEDATGFATEETSYSALYSRDVNNYLAVKPDGSVKRKGVFATGTLSKNPVNEICMGAVTKHLVDGTPVEQSIRGCTDIRKFLTIRTVKGGAVQDDQYLGRAARWYYALGELGTINYKVNGYTVARSEGAKPLMELPDEFPSDVDYQWYIDEAHQLLRDIGAVT